MRLTSRLLADLPRNARYSVLLEPIWAVLGTVVIYYATLYMTTSGLSTIRIGLIVSISSYVAVLFQLVAGVLTDRMGRRRATLVFDLLSWVVPMLIWAVADNFWLFLLGYLFNATSRVVNVSFSLLATEDVAEEQRPRVFAAIKLIITAAGLLTPLVGLCMRWYGILPTLRVVYLVGGLCMLAHVLLRNQLTVETAAGERALRAHRSISVPRGLGQSLRMFRSIAGNPRRWPLVGIYVLTYLAWQINIFQVVYLADVLHFEPAAISYLPALGALVALVCYLVVMPRLRRRPVERNTLGALIGCAAGWLLFLLVPPHGLVLLLVSTVLTAAGLFLVESYRDALLVSRLDGADRAGMFSAVQTITAVVAIPSGYVSAVLYERSAPLLFAVIGVLYAAAAICTRLLMAGSPAPLAGSDAGAPAPREERSWSGA